MIPILILDVLLGAAARDGVAYVRGSLTDRAIMVIDRGAVDLVPGLHHRRPVPVRVPARLVPGAGLERQLLDQPGRLRAAAGLLAVFGRLAPQTRLYRSFFLDEINQDYVRTARAKGLTENRVLFKHVLRNAMIPILTNVACNCRASSSARS